MVWTCEEWNGEDLTVCETNVAEYYQESGACDQDAASCDVNRLVQLLVTLAPKPDNDEYHTKLAEAFRDDAALAQSTSRARIEGKLRSTSEARNGQNYLRF